MKIVNESPQEPINPLLLARQQKHLTQRAVAKKVGLTSYTILLSEAGLYRNVSPRLLEFYEDASLANSYHDWVRTIRELRQIPRITMEELTSRVTRVTNHPFVPFRRLLAIKTGRALENKMTFCKYALVHHASLVEYESGRQRRMPAQIREALDDLGIRPEIRLALTGFVSEWHERERIARVAGRAAS